MGPHLPLCYSPPAPLPLPRRQPPSFSLPPQYMLRQTLRNFTTTTRTMAVTKTIITEGSGPTPNKGDRVTMTYTGWLRNPGLPDEKGSVFDSTSNPGRTDFVTAIGVGQVIKGWDESVINMKVGEKARLDITSDYGYGARGAGAVIPPNADLIFEVQLKKIN